MCPNFIQMILNVFLISTEIQSNAQLIHVNWKPLKNENQVQCIQQGRNQIHIIHFDNNHSPLYQLFLEIHIRFNWKVNLSTFIIRSVLCSKQCSLKLKQKTRAKGTPLDPPFLHHCNQPPLLQVQLPHGIQPEISGGSQTEKYYYHRKLQNS